MRLGREFFERPTVELARALLGKRLAMGALEGKIVETEAYLFRGDPGCHAARGRTTRNAPMFGPAGTAYVYLIYGMHHCLNVVSGREGEGEAVLIRALEPLAGIEAMRERRGGGGRGSRGLESLCSGPGRLTRAFGITRAHNGSSLIDGEMQILDSREKPEIRASARIGLSAGEDLQLRFFVAGSAFVSGTKAQNGGKGEAPRRRLTG